MQTVTSDDGTRIAYDQTGTGPPLVVVHGGWDGHAAWRLVLPMLAEQLTVYAIDRRGCGPSDPNRHDYEVERDLEDVAAFVDGAALVFLHEVVGVPWSISEPH